MLTVMSNFHDTIDNTVTGDEVSIKKAKTPEALLNICALAILPDKTSRQSALGIWMIWWPSVLQGGDHLPSM